MLKAAYLLIFHGLFLCVSWWYVRSRQHPANAWKKTGAYVVGVYLLYVLMLNGNAALRLTGVYLEMGHASLEIVFTLFAWLTLSLVVVAYSRWRKPTH